MRPMMSVGKGPILRAAQRPSSEANDEGASTHPVREILLSGSPKKNLGVHSSTRNSPFIHRFSTLDRPWGRDYAWIFMTARKFAGVFVVCGLLIGTHAAWAQDATFFRVFLKDGN